MSGGVDSSVTAALLKQQGYRVVGVYMKNWTKDIPGFECPWKEDFQDAKRVAVQLGIEFKVFDFENDYKQKVVDYMIDEYKAGRTPNPDIMCNQEIKFKLFFDTAMEEGADLITTGHYARVRPLTTLPASHAKQAVPQSSQRATSSDSSVLAQRTKMYDSLRASSHPRISSEPRTSPDRCGLFRAKDDNKDQTYFLYRMSEAALQKTLFPLGDYTKPEVRELAKKFNLVTAGKKESMGICFVGKVGIKEFLSQYVKTSSGAIIDQTGKTVGKHDGAIFYTIGQRHGLNVGGGLPYYVVGKDMAKNEVYVTTDLDDKRLWSKTLQLTDVHWINGQPGDKHVQVRTRHRAPLITGTLDIASGTPDVASPRSATLQVALDDEIRAVTPGQSAVFYQHDHVLGGGIIV